MHEQHVLLCLNKVGVEAPCTSLDALMFDYLAFDAAVAGAVPGGTSGEQTFFFCVVLFPTCVRSLLECLGFT
jgi:hypothetical protein